MMGLRATRRGYGIALAVIALLAVVPCVPLVLACLVAGYAQCELNVIRPYACVIHGHDWGEALYVMGSSLSMIAYTVPLAQIAFIAWMSAVAVHLVIHNRRKRRATPLASNGRME